MVINHGHFVKTGQIAITNTVPLTNIDPDEIRAVLSEYKMTSASVAIHQPDATLEDLIDVVEGNRYVWLNIHGRGSDVENVS